MLRVGQQLDSPGFKSSQLQKSVDALGPVVPCQFNLNQRTVAQKKAESLRDLFYVPAEKSYK